MSIGRRIKEERLRNGFSQEDVARSINTTKQAIYKYESGIVTNIPNEKVSKLAALFGVTPSYLMGWHDTADTAKGELAYAKTVAEVAGKKPHPRSRDVEVRRRVYQIAGVRPIRRKRLPLLGNVACGEPIFADEQHESYVDADAGVDADFCLVAKGDSMINARIFDGDVLFVKREEMVDDGEIAVVLVEDEATVKRVYYDREASVITLVPENPMHKAMRYEGDKLDQIRILGKVVAAQYTIR